MIVQLLLGVVLGFFTLIFSVLPQTTTLPPINGFDIDTYLVNGVGMTYNFASAAWPIRDMLIAFIFLLGYFLVKNLILRFFLGHRAPS